MMDHPELIKTAFEQAHGEGKSLTRTDKMNARHSIAKSLLANDYSNLTSELQDKVTAHHKAELNEWNLILDDISASDNVAQYVPPLFSLFVGSCLCS